MTAPTTPATLATLEASVLSMINNGTDNAKIYQNIVNSDLVKFTAIPAWIKKLEAKHDVSMGTKENDWRGTIAPIFAANKNISKADFLVQFKAKNEYLTDHKKYVDYYYKMMVALVAVK